MNDIRLIAKQMVAPNKGVLAADESSPTIAKRLTSIGVESTVESRRAYRELICTAPDLNKYISGMILFDETLRDKTSGGELFGELLSKKGILPGIKVDMGGKDLAFYPGEKATDGLDGLRERLVEYVELGAKFTKWRAIIVIGDQTPSEFGNLVNAHGLARFAALSQEAGLVPIVEPEVLMDGSHTIEKCEEVTKQILKLTFEQLRAHKVDLEGMILKPNMVISGKECDKQANAGEIAEATLRCFREVVPAEVPGCVFLSGGQSPEEATVNLNEISKSKGGAPWELSYSYGRGLQAEALAAWEGKEDNVEKAHKALIARSKSVSEARMGQYAT